MDGAKGSALEWALALLHAPGKRHALRQKPLPTGMDGLLGIAAGAMPDELAEAARTFREPEARIREAAQFYVREVLFFPQADAYRVLGVGADASDASIKAHHRLLQHWLHPDRLHNEDDAIFATRVNVAWNRLRNPQRRQAYDKTLQEDQLPEAFDGNDGLGGVHAWIPAADVVASDWRHRLPMLALSAACVLLVVLVVRDMDRGPRRWEGVSSEEPGNAPTGDGMEISVPRRAGAATPVTQVRKHAEGVRAPQVEMARLPPVPVAAPPPVVAAAIETAAMTWQDAGEQPSIPEAVPLPARPPAGMVPASVPVHAAPASAAAQGAAADDPARSADAYAGASQPASRPQALPSYARIQQAWAAGDQLLRFMGGAGRPPPPIWSSPGIQSSADLLRQDMHDAGRVRLSDPQWQIGERSAVLTSGYIVKGKGVNAGDGRLTADWVWREGRWLVVGLSIERVQ